MLQIRWMDCRKFNDSSYERAAFSRLSVERQEICRRYKNTSDRRRSLAAGTLVEDYFRQNGFAEPYSYAYSERGKPYLLGHPGTYFNISHSGNYAACVFADSEVGLDIEMIDRSGLSAMSESLIHSRFLAKTDKEAFLNAPSYVKPQALLQIWTLAEAIAKASDHPVTEALALGLYSMALSLDEDPKNSCTAAFGGRQWEIMQYVSHQCMTACASELRPGMVPEAWSQDNSL